MIRRGLSAQLVPAQTPGFERAGLEVLDQHVGLGGQPAHQGLALGLAQVGADRALVARRHLPPDRGALAQQPPLAQRIAAFGRFDLDDVGAEVGQRLGGEGAGDQLAELDHLEALQGLRIHVDLKSLRWGKLCCETGIATGPAGL